MKHASTASGRWTQLDGQRQGFLFRSERYSAYTLPKILPPQGYNQNSNDLQHDYQSVGAQAVNHLANKLMLAMYAPSRPFFRLEADDATIKQLAAINVDETQLAEVLSIGEKKAVKLLDTKNVRPKLYESVKHLIVVGNCMVCMDGDTLRVLGLRNYVVSRSNAGRVHEMITQETVTCEELDPSIRDWIEANRKAQNRETDPILYKWFKLNDAGDFTMTQWIDQDQLPAKFNGKWPEAKCPYVPLTWDLSDGADYGTGLVEEYAGDFSSLSNLSQSVIQAAILASEFRWLVNPGGMTKPEDMERSPNGAALPGLPTDVTLLSAGAQAAATIQYTQSVGTDYINRIGRGFLLAGSQIRNAERVTAEEIQLVANELESSLGGVYSRLAVDFQLPIAFWLLKRAKLSINGTSLQPSIITGLDALSRNGDIDALKQWLADMAGVASIPPSILGRLNLRAIASALAAGRGISVSTYMIPEEQYQQAMNQAAQAEAAQQATDEATQQ